MSFHQLAEAEGYIERIKDYFSNNPNIDFNMNFVNSVEGQMIEKDFVSESQVHALETIVTKFKID